MISNSGHDERGKYSGGQAGDQGGEWSRIPWYSRPWTVIFRHPDPSTRALIAQLAGEAADNDRIGYDQSERGMFWYRLKQAGYFPSAIRILCESDCSAGVAAIVKATGYILGDAKLQAVSSEMYTGNQYEQLTTAGFTALRDAKYTTSPAYLLAGDILLSEGHHTAINLDFGEKATMPKVTIENHIKATAAFFRECQAGRYQYGDSHATPPCADHVTSCDRGAVARPLWDLGLTDQPAGGVTVMNMEPWLLKHGWHKVTDPNALKRGDIVLMKQNGTTSPTAAWHTFLLTDFQKQTNCSKYDFGNSWRWGPTVSQPFVGVPLNEWSNREFYCAFRIPSGGADSWTEDDYAFDATFYRMNCPDVVKSGFSGSDEGLKKHYDTYGKAEGRAANCVLIPAAYKAKYKDLRTAFGNDWSAYIRHFAMYGVKEGRIGSVVFSAAYYRSKYKDLERAFGRDWAAYFRHFLTYGMQEGRRGSKDFDPRAYRKRYKDLDKAYGDNWPMYYRHYLIYGIKEKRKGI